MSPVAWHRGRMLGLHLTTTGPDPETDRALNIDLAYLEPGQPPATITRNLATEPLQAALCDTIGMLADAITAHVPVAGLDLAHTLTLLDRDCRRCHVAPLTDTVTELGPCVDVRVLDRHADPFRHGRRQLDDLAAHYRVKADQPAATVLRLAWAIAQRHPRYQIDLEALHGKQRVWAGHQYAVHAFYRGRPGASPDLIASNTWPINPIGPRP